MIFCEQFKDFVRNAIGPRTHRHPDHILNSQGLVIENPQFFDRSKSIGKRLKIGHEPGRLILAGHNFLALFKLCGKIELTFDTDRPRAPRIAKETTGTRTSPIAIRAAETGINGDFVDATTEMTFKMTGEKLIGLH